MTYIEPGLFFARIQPGHQFRFRMRSGTDLHEGVLLTCTGPAGRLGDAEDSLHVPFTYPDGEEGAFWRTACHNIEFEIPPVAIP